MREIDFLMIWEFGRANLLSMAEETLREAACAGDEFTVRSIIAKGVPVNSQHAINKWYVLHLAPTNRSGFTNGYGSQVRFNQSPLPLPAGPRCTGQHTATTTASYVSTVFVLEARLVSQSSLAGQNTAGRGCRSNVRRRKGPDCSVAGKV